MDEAELRIAAQSAMAQQRAAAARDVAGELVTFRQTLIEGGFTTDQAYDLTDAWFSSLLCEPDPDLAGQEG